jgi:TonB-dependent starch-binding outer membrane protein SusC
MSKSLHKIKWLVMVILFTSSSFGVNAQQLTAFVKNQKQSKSAGTKKQMQSLGAVLAQVKRQYQVNFHYDSDLVASRRADATILEAGKENLDLALTQLLKPLALTFIKADAGSYIIVPVRAQPDKPASVIQAADVVVTGKVTDKKGEPLPGVTVLLKGTTLGTTTAPDGSFTLQLPEATGTLVVSFVGYTTQEVAVPKSGSLQVVLADDAKALDEVVVVGYGTQSTRNLSSSVATIAAKDLADLPVAQFSQKLQGKVSGVQITQTTGTPGAGMDIRIRGAASITAGDGALYVVDGNPIVGGINNINPNEIESISVLKDASATALYGSRGANGVVLIETRKAAPGKTRLDYNAYYGVQQVPQRGRPDMMNAREFATFRKEIAEARNQPVHPDFQNPEQYQEGTDWYDAITQVAPMQDHSLSLSTGTETFSTTATAGFLRQEGVLVGSGYDRYSLRVNTRFQPHEKVSIGLNVAPTYSKNTNSGVDGVGSVINETLQTSPLAPLRNPDGSLTLTAFSPGMFPTPNYVRTQLDRVVDNSDTRILANLFAEYQIAKGLFIKTSGNIDKGDSRGFNFNGTTTGARGTGLYVRPFSSLNQGTYLSWVNENILTYRLDVQDHSVDAIVGFTAQSFRQDNSTINGTNYTDDKVQTINAASTITATSNVQEWSLLSYLTRVNYNYKGKYLVTASVRRDGSSRFGKQNRWGNFPSASVGWILTEEGFMPAMAAISFVKLRASYGIAGNFNIGNYTHIPTISGANYAFGNTIAAGRRVDNLADQRLGWETNKQFNIGLDLNLFQDRVRFTYNYYRTNTSDLLFNVRVPRASGFANIQTNIGELKFWGHEFSVSSANIQQEGFSWTTDFNISFDRNQVVAMGTRNANLITGPGSGLIGGSHITTVGQPVGMLYGMMHEGVYDNQAEFDRSPKHSTSQVGTAKFRDTNGDGIITVDDATIIGSPHPDFIFGMTNMVQVKSFDVALTLSGSYGNEVLRGAEQTLTNLDGVFNVLANVQDRWRSPENPGSGRYGSLAAGTTYLERDWWGTQMLYDASHLYINNITLGYRVPEANTGFLRSLRVYGSIQNAFVFTSYPGANPQVSQSQASTELGIDGGSYPVPRTFTLGVNIGF